MHKPLSHYRALFPVTEHYAYLNHAACTPLPRPGLDELARHWAAQSTMGTLSEPPDWERIEEVRASMARLIGAKPTEIGWVQNTAMAIATVAHGLDWSEGDNIVTVQGEFPANVYPWLDLQHHGVETRFVPQRDNRVLVEDIAAAIDERTRLVSVSVVEFATGFRNDLAAIGRLCRERGVLFNVDGIQGLGALQVDVREANIDFMGAGTHKWLMGPHGVGVFYAREELIEGLSPITANWASVVDRDDHLNYGQPWVGTAARVEGSTRNVSGILAFGAVLDMIHEVGPARIEARIMELTGRLIDGLQERGCDLISSTRPGERSGVVCFRTKGDPKELFARAQAERIVIAVRVGAVRVAPHFYNNEEEIDRLLRLL
ncbi:MAG TPA: aminotransferase class V-fold PLP-dependent enzyme [Chloroflexia bacterium]|nr:aminotransferase class V-fold PLP-dependent enzyme [Chloroflexia bacterium]